VRISSSRPQRPRGFTLIEVAVVLAIITVLAVAAYTISRAQARNVQLSQAAGELQLRAAGLRSKALSDGQDHLLVVVDAPNNDASQCGWSHSAGCARYFILYSPLATWTLGGFDPANPGANASVSEIGYLPRGARLYRAASYHAPPAPFDNVVVFDSRFYGTCANGASCLAFRFTMSGSVHAEQPAGGTQTAAGLAFVLASDAELEGAGGDHRGVAVGFPSGIVKAWPYGP